MGGALAIKTRYLDTIYPSIDHTISQFCTVRLVALVAGLLCSQIFFWVIGIASLKSQTVRLASGGVSSLGGWHPRLPRRFRLAMGCTLRLRQVL
jgi:hypothetical protein